MKKVLWLVLVSMFTSACSTMGEVISSDDSPAGYRKKPSESGKYVRQRVIQRRPESPVQVVNHWLNPYQDSDRHSGTPSHIRGPARHQVIAASVSDDMAPSLNLRYGMSTSVAKKEEAVHLGLEAEFDFLQDWLTGRLGMSILSSDYTYWGGTLGVRASVPHWKVSPYLGAEAYLGDHKSCDYENLGNGDLLETCEKVFLATSYLEMGAVFKIFENTRAYIFSRGYSSIDQSARDELIMFYGVSLMFSL